MDNRLHILWVKMGGLWPITSGGRLRSFHIIDELSRHHNVTVLTTSDSESENTALSSHLPDCQRVKSFLFKPPKKDSRKFIGSLAASWLTPLPVDLYKYQCPALRREVESELNSGRFDLCIADFLTSVPNIPLQGRTPKILFSHNVEYMIWRRLYDNEKNWLKRFLLAIEWRKMRRSETQACNAAAATIAVSKEDARLLLQGSPEARITSVVTGVDINFFKPDAAKGKHPTSLVFSGSMDWHPNEDAILHFMDRILPIIRLEIPDARLSIVGRNPSERLQAAAKIADVEVTGTVADIRPWLHRAAVYIVPLRVGGGTRLKIYEALAMGKAVVSTTIGAEGLNLRNDVHLLRADGEKEFARQTVRLLRNPELAQDLGMAGRQLMEANYAWSQVARQFENLCREALPSAQNSTHQQFESNHGKDQL
ncbi:MAG: glycosyltransferase family 4 protein [Pseudohongiella sp.]|uniref:glycosyltransferase family 4 protein n=1 Tax=Pseudohongiella sp. TaxID=1979412 RepID=UPI0034A043C5